MEELTKEKGGEKMKNIGKHSKEVQRIRELEETIRLKEQEIQDIKAECANEFKRITEFCTCNDYNGRINKMQKIYELATDNFMLLVQDILMNKEEKDKKIIELSTEIK